jgi:hypothetical protein
MSQGGMILDRSDTMKHFHSIFLTFVLAGTAAVIGQASFAADDGDGATPNPTGAFSCRFQPLKGQLLKKYGGSEETEAAVAAGLKWMIAHQLPDGGWSFDHTLAPSCDGTCRDRGDLATARVAATSLALLPLLAAGHTHLDGDYQDSVRSGVDFLVKSAKATDGGSSLHESGGTMYSHGLGTLVLCELYAMTGDEKYKTPAQAAVDFIVYAQDPVGGGWRYMPRSPGDTSVTGWQVSALKAAQLGGLSVPDKVRTSAHRFLDSVGAEGGAFYGYTTPAKRQTTTAVGLLCRQNLGWQRENPAMTSGVKWLGSKEMPVGNLYCDCYVTQVLHNYGGRPWKRWNKRLSKYLLETQSHEGHEAGSWISAGGGGVMGGGIGVSSNVNAEHGASRGGRLYSTALCLLCLEAYYRYPEIAE